MTGAPAAGESSVERLRKMNENSWYILHGEPLPAPPSSDQEPKS